MLLNIEKRRPVGLTHFLGKKGALLRFHLPAHEYCAVGAVGVSPVSKWRNYTISTETPYLSHIPILYSKENLFWAYFESAHRKKAAEV